MIILQRADRQPDRLGERHTVCDCVDEPLPEQAGHAAVRCRWGEPLQNGNYATISIQIIALPRGDVLEYIFIPVNVYLIDRMEKFYSYGSTISWYSVKIIVVLGSSTLFGKTILNLLSWGKSAENCLFTHWGERINNLLYFFMILVLQTRET